MSGDAVIFIPGIKGTKLLETNRPTWDTIWSGIQYNFETIEDLELTAEHQGRFFEEGRDSIIRPGEIEALAYGEFLNDLDSKKPKYIFNYDWRLSARENGKRLSGFMDYLTAKSQARADNPNLITKFDVITHSLGQAILRNLLHREGMTRINKIVFTVPPFKGSLDIVVTALIGEGFFKGVRSNIRRLIRTMPGALELLPTYEKASYYKSSKKHTFFKFSQWQSNVQNDESDIPRKMKKALSLAKNTVEKELCDLNTLTDAERERILILVRGGVKTWQSVPIYKNSNGTENFVDFNKGLQTKDGDGRVPHASSCVYHDTIKTLIIEDDLWFRDYDHGLFLKDERAQKLVNLFLFEPEPFRPRIPGRSVMRVAKLTQKDSGKKACWKVARKTLK